jgi:hypothetical protein
MSDPVFRRAAAAAAILSLPLAAGNLITTLHAVDCNLDAFSNPLILLHAGAAGADWWRWSMILDLFGYYLLIVPLILFLRRWLRPRHPDRIDLFSLCLLAYSLIGAIGATMLATVTPPIIASYAGATPSQRAILEALSNSWSDAVYRGLWNLLEEFLAGVGWLGLGLCLRGRLRGPGWASILLGAACLTDSIASALRLDTLAMAGLAVYLVLAPVWACWTGVSLLRLKSVDDAEIGDGT